MKFAVAHEIDASIGAVELAVISSELPSRIAAELGGGSGGAPSKIESVETLAQRLDGGELERHVRYRAAGLVPALERVLRVRAVTRDMLAWEERFSYVLATHAGRWEVTPLEAYARYFIARGTYRLEAMDNGSTKRVVEGTLEVRVRLLGRVIERIALGEVTKQFEAEARALKALASLEL